MQYSVRTFFTFFVVLTRIMKKWYSKQSYVPNYCNNNNVKYTSFRYVFRFTRQAKVGHGEDEVDRSHMASVIMNHMRIMPYTWDLVIRDNSYCYNMMALMTNDSTFFSYAPICYQTIRPTFFIRTFPTSIMYWHVNARACVALIPAFSRQACRRLQSVGYNQ